MWTWLSGRLHEIVWWMYPPCMSLGWTWTALTERTLAGSVYEAAK